MKRNMTFSVLGALALMAAVLAIARNPTSVNAQTSGSFPDLDKNGKPLIPRPNPFVIYSPTDLGHSSVTLPANPTATANTVIVRMSGVTKLTYFMNCTQSAKLTMNVYTADDKASPLPSDFTLYGSYDVFTAISSGAQQIYIASELAPNTTSGTTGAAVRLPQYAVSFSETNAGATPGTCTDRLMLGYN